MFKYIVSMFLLFTATGVVSAQGWEHTFGGGAQDEAKDLAITPDGGYILAGSYSASNKISLIKTDIDGRLQWSKPLSNGLSPLTEGRAVIVTSDSNYVVVGVTLPFGGSRDVYLTKTDPFGNVLWSRQYGGTALLEEGNDVVELPDGSLVITGYRQNNDGTEDILLIKTDALGNQVWLKTYGAAGVVEKSESLVAMDNGDLVLAGNKFVTSNMSDPYVVRVDAAGALLWDYTYNLTDSAGQSASEVTTAIISTDDGNLILAGYSGISANNAGFLIKISAAGSPDYLWSKAIPSTEFYDVVEAADGTLFSTGVRTISALQDDLYIGHFDANGNLICETTVGKAGPDQGYGIVATPDGGATAAGGSEKYFPLSPLSERSVYLVKTDAACTVLTSYIRATVFFDENDNCQRDSSEETLRNWVVRENTSGFPRYFVSNALGQFQFAVDTGSYILELVPPNNLWEGCQPSLTVFVPEFYDTVHVDIPVRSAVDCPRNEVDIATPFLRSCADNVYTVQYCNTGSVISNNTYVEVQLDAALSLTASSLAAVPQGGNRYRFNVGTVETGQCGSFTLTAFLDCDPEVLGRTFCVKAHIYPDSFCAIGNWNGAIVEAIAECDSASNLIRMKLANRGGAPTGPLHFIIAEDVVMLTPPGGELFNIMPEDTTEVWTHVPTGLTYRIIAEQVPDYPGVSYPTAAVEGCLTMGSNDTVSLGAYTMFPEDDADVFIEYDCQEALETDYNAIYLKKGHPKGLDVDSLALYHLVRPETDLEYLIYFNNTGSDTVHQVIVRDTLSPLLDPTTVQPGAASHPYQYELYGPGIVQFTLSNLNLLPGGSSASSGFVKFRIAQKPIVDEECGTRIYNSAAIYFDFNAPVLTNQVFHTPCPLDSFPNVTVKTNSPIEYPGAAVTVVPNPFAQSADFTVSGVTAQTYTLELYDIQGRLLFNQFYQHPTFRLHRQYLPSGILFYRLAADGRPVASGRVVVE